MTELNPDTDARPENPENPASPENPGNRESAEARIDWPSHPGDPAAGGPTVGDPAVDALLGRLGALPELPVSAHGEVYTTLHDELAAALNEDVAGQAAGERRP